MGKNSYIQVMNNSRGSDWILSVRPEDIQHSTKRIVKDMVKGNIEYEKYGMVFLDAKFLENLLIGVSNELESNTFNYQGCMMLYQAYPGTPNLAQHVNHLGCLVHIYTVIKDRLEHVKFTGDIGCLTNIPGLLYNERFHLV
jgi:hypothetical protein